MKGTLDVYLYTTMVGMLHQDEHGQTLFQYIPEWLKNPDAVPISLSLPLQEEMFGERQCKPFFAGILPDQAKRTLIAKNLGISANNDFTMLEQIGGECAGAITFMTSGISLPPIDNAYRTLEQDELAAILKELPKRPLMAGEDGIRLSLAGAQDKIAVFIQGYDLMLPMNSAPSSHIIKPAIESYDGMVFNEAFCMMLAQQIGLMAANVSTGRTGAIDYLLVERYDRTRASQQIGRIHQEDFCQALGIAADLKYETEGGPSLRQCFELIRTKSSLPAIDLMSLLDAVFFNFLIGNHDAHGKNFSLLYPQSDHGRSVRMAPLYDLVCTAVYPALSTTMAMRIGKAKKISDVDPHQLDKLADDIGFAKPLIRRRLIVTAEKILAGLDSVNITHPIVDEIKQFIREHASNVLKRFNASDN